jgi:shikimate kinase
MKQNVVLTGFMGVGKTTIGRLLAEQLGYAFVDTDALIEMRTGRSIPAIFAESGEGAFRALEREVALELGGEEGLVIATGGRLMLDPVNAAALTENGRVFCLTAAPEEILARLSADSSNERPLLSGDDPARRIAELLAARQAAYEQFEQVATDGKRVGEVVDVLLGIINL